VTGGRRAAHNFSCIWKMTAQLFLRCLCDRHFLWALVGRDATVGDSCYKILEVLLAHQRCQRNGRDIAERGTEGEGHGIWRNPMLFIWEEVPWSWVAGWAYNLTLCGKAVPWLPEVTASWHVAVTKM